MPDRPIVKIDATSAKHRFGEVLRHAGNREVVALSKRGRDVAYVIPPELFESLHQVREQPPESLAALEAEFDRLVANMQRAPSRRAVDRLLDASDAQINAVAAKAVRGRKR